MPFADAIVYVVIHEDKHTGVNVEVYADADDAVASAKELLDAFEDPEEYPVNGNPILYNAMLSEEGDGVRVEKTEVIVK